MKSEYMNKRDLNIQIAEHRIVKFFINEGLEVPHKSEKLKAMCPSQVQPFYTFGQLYRTLPELTPRLEFLSLPKMVRKDLTRAFTRHRDCKLTKHAERLSPGELDGLVFNFDGIKGGLIMHVVDMPKDLKSGSMYWQSGEYTVRLQRFAEFCLATRAFDRSEASSASGLNWPDLSFKLATRSSSEIAIRLHLLWLSVTENPDVAIGLQQRNLSVEFRLVDGKSFFKATPTVLAELLSSSVSTVKPGLKELVDKGIFVRAAVGRQHFAYRCTTCTGGAA